MRSREAELSDSCPFRSHLFVRPPRTRFIRLISQMNAEVTCTARQPGARQMGQDDRAASAATKPASPRRKRFFSTLFLFLRRARGTPQPFLTHFRLIIAHVWKVFALFLVFLQRVAFIGQRYCREPFYSLPTGCLPVCINYQQQARASIWAATVHVFEMQIVSISLFVQFFLCTLNKGSGAVI